MQFGFGLPTRGPMATPQNLATLARKGEELGFALLSISDHIIIPRTIASTYPYNETGTYAGDPSGACLEQLSLLSFIAGITSSAKLLTSVLVLPHRPPVLTAKMLATIDVLSNGRLIVGCGVGWMREEFAALGTPPYDERGAVGDEYLRAFKELWTSANPTFEGKYCRFANVAFAPKPVQQPHPPIWIGGESAVALRRAGRFADAWYPIGSNPRFPVGTPAQFEVYAAKVKHQARVAGRDPDRLQFAYSTNWYTDQQALTLPDGQRRSLTGTPQQIADDIKRYGDLGVRHMMVNLQGDTLAQTLERLTRFAERIMPLTR
ncbi:MAG: LLM class F420-dependent oxidoreductase [Candidatus Tectimicrobiota bacterium]